MTFSNNEVVFLDDAVIDAIFASQDPAADLDKQLAASGQSLTIPQNWDPTQQGAAPPTTFRVRLVVFNRLDADVENRRAYAIHGDQVQQPVVMLNGAPLRKPSTDPNLTNAPRLGDSSLDWIDAPPPGHGSVGIWAFDQSLYFLIPPHGVSAALQLEVAGGPTVVLCAIVDALQLERAWLAEVWKTAAITASTLDDVYNRCDQSPNLSTVTDPDVKVTLKWQAAGADGYFLFALLESTS